RHHHMEMIFDCGQLGLLPNAAHGHADALAVQLRVDGVDILGDPGTGTYFGSSQVRDALRSTHAHNTLSVDGRDQADIFATFKWVNPMRTKLLEWSLGAHFDYAHATHDGFCRLRKSVRHFRSVLLVKPWGWIIVDRLTGKGEHLLKRHFSFPPTVCLEEETSCSVAAIDSASGHGVRIALPHCASDQNCSVQSNREALWSEHYGHWQRSARLDIACTRAMPAILFTVITPIFAGDKTAKAPPSRYAVEQLDEEAVLCRRTGDVDNNTDLLLINPAGARITLPNGAHTDSRLLFLRHDSTNQVERAWIAPGSLHARDLTLRTAPGEHFTAFVQQAGQRTESLP